jgi:hypothetical protein
VATETEVINSALIKLGANPITSRSDATKPARVADARFDSVRDAELRRHTWPFACKRDELSALASTPAFGFLYEYQLPTDCLKVLQVSLYAPISLSDYRNTDEAHYRIEGRKILTDHVAPLPIRYVQRLTTTSQYDSALVEALASRCAYEWCEAITSSSSKRADMWSDYKIAINEAIVAGAIELPPSLIADDTWILGRA